MGTICTLIVCIWRFLETKAGIVGLAFLFGGLGSKVIKYLIAYHLSYGFFFVCIWRLFETKAGIEWLAFLSWALESKVMKVGSDTFWQPIFQMILQNQQSSPIIGAFGCFAKHFSLVKMCQNLTFKVTFLCLIFFSIGIIGLINIFCYTGIWNVWGGWFLAGNQDNHQNSISSLISQNLWLIFMGMKHFI